MLVLTRKVQQQIKVGDDITITIIRIKGQQVRVGIEAPRDVRVMRAELAEPAPTGDSGEDSEVGEAAPAMETSEFHEADTDLHADECGGGPLAGRLRRRRVPEMIGAP